MDQNKHFSWIICDVRDIEKLPKSLLIEGKQINGFLVFSATNTISKMLFLHTIKPKMSPLFFPPYTLYNEPKKNAKHLWKNCLAAMCILESFRVLKNVIK